MKHPTTPFDGFRSSYHASGSTDDHDYNVIVRQFRALTGNKKDQLTLVFFWLPLSDSN